MRVPFVKRWYDRKGNRIRSATGHELMSRGPTSPDGMRVAVGYIDAPLSLDATIAAGGSNARIIISTVWLGWDHRRGKGAPLIFETGIIDGAMMFLTKAQWKVVQRYETEAEAIEGHRAWVTTVISTVKGAVMTGGYTTRRGYATGLDQIEAPALAKRPHVAASGPRQADKN